MFLHLVNRSTYTILNSTIRIENLVNYAKKNGHNAVVLCDHNVLFGMPEFLEICNKNDIKAIIGLEIDIFDEDDSGSLAIIAKDSIGLYNLIHLSSYINSSNNININNLYKYLDHCILIIYGEGGIIESDLLNNNSYAILNKLNEIKENVDDIYVALSFMESKLWKEKNQLLKDICKEINIKTVAVNKNYYLKEDDWQYYKALRGINLKKNINDTSLTSIKGRYFLNEEEMNNLYEAEDINNTLEILNKCNANYVFEKAILPKPKFVKDNDSKKYLQKLCEIGLKKRLNNKKDE